MTEQPKNTGLISEDIVKNGEITFPGYAQTGWAKGNYKIVIHRTAKLKLI
jgi:hypothetical protein